MVLYNTIKRLIEHGQTDGLSGKIDVFFAVGKLTNEQYIELAAMLEPTNK